MEQQSSLNTRQSILPPRQTFSFPKLRLEEILKCLQELGIQITHDDLVYPEKNPSTIRAMLEVLAEICTGISREDLYQPTFEGLKAIQYPELHEESIPTLNIFRACAKMMEICAIHDFTIKDLISPTAIRLRNHLSGVINFCKFREERLNMLHDLEGTRSELISQLNEATEQQEALNTRLGLLREQTSDEGEMIIRLEAECKEMEVKILELEKLDAETSNEVKMLEASNNVLKEKVDSQTSKLEETNALKSHLSSQIISSPEKFRQQIKDVAASVQADQKEVKQAERKLRDLTAWIEHVDDAQKEVEKALSAAQDLRQEVYRQKELIKDIDKTKEGIEQAKADINELKDKVSSAERESARKEEKLNKMKEEQAEFGEKAQLVIEKLHGKLVEEEKRQVSLKNQLEAIEDECNKMEREAENQNIHQENEILEIKKNYSKMESVVISHLRKLQVVLEANIDNPSLDISNLENLPPPPPASNMSPVV